MNKRISVAALAVAIILLGGSFIRIFSVHATAPLTPSAPAAGLGSFTTITPAYAQTVVSALPDRIVIPNAKVNAKVDQIGVTPQGNLDVPPNFVDAGWYMYGTQPGQIGSTVIDGHVDNGASIKGVFKYLRDLKSNDLIYIHMTDGRTLTYKVIRSQAYKLKDFPGDMVFHETGDAYLKIITCHGTFIPSMNTYDQRLIVSAVLVK